MAQTYHKLPELSAQDIQRFWNKVDRRSEDECWPWTAVRDVDGYGIFRVSHPRRINVRAHRIAYLLHAGKDPWPLVVRHLVCDNPPCCNGSHLAKGTILENNHDSLSKGRAIRGERRHCAKLKESDVLVIRELHKSLNNCAKIARMYDVHPSTVVQIIARLTWTHI